MFDKKNAKCLIRKMQNVCSERCKMFYAERCKMFDKKDVKCLIRKTQNVCSERCEMFGEKYEYMFGEKDAKYLIRKMQNVCRKHAKCFVGNMEKCLRILYVDIFFPLWTFLLSEGKLKFLGNMRPGVFSMIPRIFYP